MDALIGCHVILRTGTFIYVGALVSSDADCIVLRDASTVFFTGRWGVALASGELEEFEVHPPGAPLWVFRSAGFLDIQEWRHPLPSVSVVRQGLAVPRG